MQEPGNERFRFGAKESQDVYEMPPEPTKEPVKEPVARRPEEPIYWEDKWLKFHETFPVGVPEILAVLIGIFCVDFFCYQGLYIFGKQRIAWGASGWAAFFAIMPVVLWLGSRNPGLTATRCVLTGMIWLAAAKIWFAGSVPAGVCAMVLLVFLGAAGTRVEFYVGELARYLFTSIFSGGKRLWEYAEFLGKMGGRLRMPGVAAVLVPLLAVGVFGWIFIMANPTLQTYAQWVLQRMQKWLTYLPHVSEVAVWVVSAWFLAGFLMPRRFFPIFTLGFFSMFEDAKTSVPAETTSPAEEEKRSPYYAVYFNTLIALCVLFAANLIFEFGGTFFGKWPREFNYGDYCENGARWLTFALFLATVVQGLIFRREIYRDDRVGTLKKWAILWTVMNFLLTLAIYIRIFIYMEQNGLTWYRVFGVFGTTTVAVGLFWILLKLLRRHDFPWLIRRYIATVGFAIFLFCVSPIDTLVHTYNSRLILSGDYSPTISIAYQDITAEGWNQLFPLLECENETIRRGVGVFLNREYSRIYKKYSEMQKSPHASWRDYHHSEAVFYYKAQKYLDVLREYDDPKRAEEERNNFEEYGMNNYFK